MLLWTSALPGDYFFINHTHPVSHKMENFWQRAKTLAEEAAKRSQQTLATTTTPARIADIVAETAKRSKDIAAEASKKAEEFRTVALSLADQIPTLSIANPISIPSTAAADDDAPSDSELERFGITVDLGDFVRGLTLSTFQNFPIQDDVAATDVASVSNVRQDLSEWQQKHAKLVLTTVKEVSRLRYELCPRHMKDRRFWRIYFTLVSTHVSAYERKYVEEIMLQQEEQTKADKAEQTSLIRQEVGGNLKNQKSTSLAEQDIDSFLLGDLEDGNPDDDEDDNDDEDFDDDFDKIDNSEIEDDK